jgi:hypothetical protein
VSSVAYHHTGVGSVKVDACRIKVAPMSECIGNDAAGEDGADGPINCEACHCASIVDCSAMFEVAHFMLGVLSKAETSRLLVCALVASCGGREVCGVPDVCLLKGLGRMGVARMG